MSLPRYSSYPVSTVAADQRKVVPRLRGCLEYTARLGYRVEISYPDDVDAADHPTRLAA